MDTRGRGSDRGRIAPCGGSRTTPRPRRPRPTRRPTARPTVLVVFNIANAGPQSLAPFVGAFLIGGGAKNDDLLYLAAAALTFVGALAILPVRKVT